MGNICSSSREEKKKSMIIEPTNATEDKSPPPCNNINDGSPKPSLDHPLKMSRQYSMKFDSKIKIDFSDTDYKAFCLLIHKDVGAVLLHCTRKKKKPPHYQLPGGHVDGYEFKQVTKSLSSYATQEQLYLAARIGCGREVYEETGMDFRDQLDRFLPMVLYSNTDEINNKSKLINEYKNRIFFVCDVFDEDFPRAPKSGIPRFSTIRYPSVPNNYSSDLMLQLSVEHSGFRFVKERSEISKSLSLHSGGKVEKAVEMAFNI